MPPVLLLIYIIWRVSIATHTINDHEYAVSYMQRFGYIENSAGTLLTKEQFEKGLKLVQKFAGIPTTGKLDERTKELLKSPRCALKDIHNESKPEEKRQNLQYGKPYNLLTDGWWKREVNYFVLNSTEKMKDRVFQDLLLKAFEMWQSVSGLIFNELTSESEADIVIAFYRGAHSEEGHLGFDGPSRIVGDASAPSNESYPTLIHFDEDEMWLDTTEYERNCLGISFLPVAVHEIGHALGLGHTCAEGSIMNPYLGYQLPIIELGYADVLAVYDLYVTSGKFEETDDVAKPNPLYYPPAPHEVFCEGNVDAALGYYDELYLFKEKVVWRIWDNMILGNRGYWIKDLFHFPNEIEKIDAAYQRRTDGKIIFFTGNQYWIFDYIYPFENQPLPITNLGFLEDVDSIDAAMSWAEDGKTYFFKNDKYWCYNETLGKMEEGYPRTRSIPVNIGASASLRNGKTYFFQNVSFWEISKTGSLEVSKHSIKELLKCGYH